MPYCLVRWVQSRAKAYIHLYLKVRFGMLDFTEREHLITEGSQDGGIDAYYIDEPMKRIYYIQSKFRQSEDNFAMKPIEPEELLRMDVSRIVRGHREDEQGNRYNGKIQGLIDALQKIPNVGVYEHEVVILANVRNLRESQLRTLVGGFPCTVFDAEKCYEELVFPVVSGTYYNPNELIINIDFSSNAQAPSIVTHAVMTEYAACNVALLFVPTQEIARIMYTYKNSILQFNPRSYLGLAKNPVNREIEKTILEMTTNEFSLLNNGITMLSDQTSFSNEVGRPYSGQLVIRNPQIINGGQTAFTLSKIYKDLLPLGRAADVFRAKEVLLRVITVIGGEQLDPRAKRQLIEIISVATNQQTTVEAPDRRSNERVQVELQSGIYQAFGYFYERKRGEFHDGLSSRYIDEDKLVPRISFIKICYATAGKPDVARAANKSVLFSSPGLETVLRDARDYKKQFFAYQCYKWLDAEEKKFSKNKNNKYGVLNYGNALRYGKYAVVSVGYATIGEDVSATNIEQLVADRMNHVLGRWRAFEEYAKATATNVMYFHQVRDDETGGWKEVADFDSYYKVSNLANDLSDFFGINWIVLE